MSIAGTYQNIKGVVVDRRRRPLARRKKLIEREVWVVEAGDIIQNVGFTIMIDSRFSGPASATPQLGTQNIDQQLGFSVSGADTTLQRAIFLGMSDPNYNVVIGMLSIGAKW